MENLNNAINQADLIVTCRMLYPMIAESTIGLSAPGTFSRLATCYAIKQALTNLKQLKSHSFCASTTKEVN